MAASSTSHSTYMDRKYTWRFDAIVMRIEAPGRCFSDKDKLFVTVELYNRVRPTITGSSRINVAEFSCVEPLVEFKLETECLRDSLLTNGINFAVKYCKDLIGCGHLKISENIGARLCTLQPPKELTHTAEVELVKGPCTVGLMTIRFRLQMICPADDDDDDDEEANLDPCSDVPKCFEKDMDCFLGKKKDNDNKNEFSCKSKESNPQKSRSPCGRLKSGDDFREMLNKLCNKEAPQKQSQSQTKSKSLKKGLVSSTSNGSSSEENEYNYRIETPAHKIPTPVGDVLVNKLCPKISAPLLKQTHFKTPRLCPICLEDVSWLPKLAACAFCGYKSVPIVEEKPFDENATAHQILQDQLLASGDGSSEYDGDMSAHEDKHASDKDFDTLIKNYKYLKQSIKQSFECETTTTTTNVKKPATKAATAATATDDTSHLVQVFTELQTLFERHEAKPKPPTIKEVCEDACKVEKELNKEKKRNKAELKKIEAVFKPPPPPPKPKKRKRNVKRISKQIKSRLYSALEVRSPSHARLGHKTCINGYSAGRKNVPGHMGWLWTSGSMGNKPGWRPGAIRRSIRELMGYFLVDYPIDTVPVSKYMSYYKDVKPKPAMRHNQEKKSDLVQHPTLHILKKNDEYIITLRPLKNADDLQKCANPYVDMKPIQFRIVKSPLLKQVRDMKRCLKSMGFNKCVCHRPVITCYCRSFIDKKRLLFELNKQCKKRNMDNCKESIVLSDTTESESEYDFSVTPPAGIVKPERLVQVDRTNNETQYDESDWALPTLFPLPPNALVQYAGCSMGERKGRFRFIYGKGDVHAKPKKPKHKTTKKKSGKRLKAGGVGNYSSYTEDSDEEYFRPGYENKQVGTNSKPLRGALAPLKHMEAPRTKAMPIKHNQVPLTESRIRRLTLASIPPASRVVKFSEPSYVPIPEHIRNKMLQNKTRNPAAEVSHAVSTRQMEPRQRLQTAAALQPPKLTIPHNVQPAKIATPIRQTGRAPPTRSAAQSSRINVLNRARVALGNKPTTVTTTTTAAAAISQLNRIAAAGVRSTRVTESPNHSKNRLETATNKRSSSKTAPKSAIGMQKKRSKSNQTKK